MSFETQIVCDQDDCNSRRDVDAPGQLPDGWIFIEWVRPPISLLSVNGRPQQKQQARKIMCGWRCLQKEVKKNLVEKVDG